MKTKELCRVISQEMISPDIYSLWIETKQIAAQAKPGQFVALYSADKSRMLPRPISLCEIGADQKSIRLVYRIAGAGTKEFSALRTADTIEVMGPLGNGFPMEEAKGKRALLMGGGIGIPPMVETAKQLSGDVTVVCGYRDALFLTEELSYRGLDQRKHTSQGSFGGGGADHHEQYAPVH